MSVRVPDHVHHVDDSRNVVVMNADNGRVFGLDNSGALIWRTLAETGSEDVAARAIADRYGITDDRARTDVRAFVDQLVEQELLVRGEAE
ncbi:MAG TPA: PqqD family protein [Actinopolymorphaceae bacterium]